MDDIKTSSNRSFGTVFFVVFVLIAFYPLINQDEIRIWSLVLSLLFLILGLLNSRILTPLNLLWFKLGMFLGKIFTPILMGLVFFLVVTPTGIIMRMLKKDLLNLKKKNSKSYWLERKTTRSDMRNQF